MNTAKSFRLKSLILHWCPKDSSTIWVFKYLNHVWSYFKGWREAENFDSNEGTPRNTDFGNHYCKMYILLKRTEFIGNVSRPYEYRQNSKKHITEIRTVRYVYCDQFFSHTSVLSISGSAIMMYAESQTMFWKNTSTAVQVLWCGKFQDVSTVPAATCFLILNNASAGFHAENMSPALFWLGHSSADSCINPGWTEGYEAGSYITPRIKV